MRSSRINFSIRSLLGLVAISSIAIAFFAFERTAELQLPPTEVEPDRHVNSLCSDAVISAVVRAIPDDERPRPLRGKSPDYQWLRQNLKFETDQETKTITISIATRRATTTQLRQLLDSFSQIRVTTVAAKASRLNSWRWFADSLSETPSRMAKSVPVLQNFLADDENDE